MTAPAPSPPILRGPADPATFRVEVGRYKDRWYHDPLPGDDIAPAAGPDDAYPAVSIVKNSWPKYLDAWTAAEAAAYAVDNVASWSSLDRTAAIDLIKGASSRTRDAAAARGTEIHRLLEQIADGHEPNAALIPDAEPYLPVLRQLVADLSPVWVLSEVVAIRRGAPRGMDDTRPGGTPEPSSPPSAASYGGTLDAAWQLDVGPLTGLYLLDFKTKKPGKHDVYPDAAAQLGAYADADYYVVEEGGQAVRAPVPAFTGGLIITITPEDYRLHPVDLAEAAITFRTLRAFHERVKTKVVGRHVVVPRAELKVPPVPVVAAPVLPDPFDGLVSSTPASSPADLIAQHRTETVVAAGAERVAVAAVGQPETPAAPAPPSAPPRIPASEARRTWAYMRLVAITTAVPTAPIVWPEGVATFRQIREGSAGPHTDAEIDAIVAALAPIEAAARLPFPDEDPAIEAAIEAARSAKRLAEESQRQVAEAAASARTPIPADDERVQTLISRLTALPDDLFDLISAELAGDGPHAIPPLTSGRCTEAHLAVLDEWLTVMEERAEERAARVAATLAALAELYETDTAPPDVVAAIDFAVSAFPPDLACDLGEAIVEALIIGTLEAAVDTLGVSNVGADHLVASYGSKAAFLAAAKAAAKATGLRPPTSTAAALSDPILVAVMSVADGTPETTAADATPSGGPPDAPALVSVPDLPAAGASPSAAPVPAPATPLDAA